MTAFGLPEFLLACVEQDEREARTPRDLAECRVKLELLKIHRRDPYPGSSSLPDQC